MITFYDATTGAKKFDFTNPCNDMNWAGSIGSYELFTHFASPVCGCSATPGSPCPVGLQVEGNAAAVTMLGSHLTSTTTLPLPSHRFSGLLP